jgi:putative addiction module component (TIGR02574 family)
MVFPMALTCLHLAEQALALPLEERRQLAELLLDSLPPDDEPTDEEWPEILRTQLADLQSGKDPGFSFEEVFGEKL